MTDDHDAIRHEVHDAAEDHVTGSRRFSGSRRSALSLGALGLSGAGIWLVSNSLDRGSDGTVETQVSDATVFAEGEATYESLTQALTEAHKRGRRVVAAGHLVTDQTLTIRADCDFRELGIEYRGAGVAVAVQPDPSRVGSYVLPTIENKNKGKGWVEVAGSVGVRIINVNMSDVFIPSITGFETGVSVEGVQHRGSCYNRFFLGWLNNNKHNLHLTCRASGWVNDNTFIGGRLTHNSDEAVGGSGNGMSAPASGTRHIILTKGVGKWAGPNSNRFLGLSLESTGATECQLEVIEGYSNLFQGCRWEAMFGGGASDGSDLQRPQVRWGADARHNSILDGYGASQIVERHAGGGYGNSHGDSLHQTRVYADQPLGNVVIPGGEILSNISGVDSPVIQIMRPHWQTEGGAAADAWCWKFTAGQLLAKGHADATALVTVNAEDGSISARSLAVQPAKAAVRPRASSVPPGTQSYDPDLKIPLWSDGNAWRDALGAVR